MSKWNELKALAEKARLTDKPADMPFAELVGAYEGFKIECTPAAILELIAENERLRGALTEIFNHIEGNTEELVRELVNWGTPKVDPNEFYAECDAVKGLVCAALNEYAA